MRHWPRPEAPADAMGRAVRLWREAPASPLHGAVCACLGGGGFVLGRDALEADLLDFLEPRYATEPALLAMLRARRAAPTGDFVDWLQRSCDGLTDELRLRLAEDVAGVLGSVGEAARGGGSSRAGEARDCRKIGGQPAVAISGYGSLRSYVAAATGKIGLVPGG